MKLVEFDISPPEQELRPLPRPLVLPAVGLAVGIAFDSWVSPGAFVIWSVVALACFAAVMAWRRPGVWPAAIGLVFVALGAARYDLAMNRWSSDHVSRYVGERPILGTIRGEIVDVPETYSPGAGAARAYESLPRTRFVIRAREWIDTAGQGRPACGKVLTYVSPPSRGLEPGDEVRVFGLVSLIPGPANPGEYDRRLQLARDGVLVMLSANTSEAVTVVARPSGIAWRRWLRAARMRLAATLRETGSGAMDESVGSVIDAMVLAKRSGVERSINDAFQKTGNSHLLAASGLNVAWLVLCVVVIGFFVGWHYRTTAAVALVVLLAYAVLAEPNPPILRAVFVGVLGCLAYLFRQRLNALNWLAAAAIVLMLFNPGVLFTASFQLSFVVVLGLVLLSSIVPDPVHAIARWQQGLDAPPADLAGVGGEVVPIRNAFIGFLVDAARITSVCALTAWLVGLPLSVYHFGAIAPWGFINSLLLAPFAFVVMVLGFVKLLTAFLPGLSAYVIGPALDCVTAAMNWCVRRLAAIPGTSIAIEPPTAVWVALCYLVMLLWLWRERGAKMKLPPLRLPRHSLKIAALLLAVWPLLPIKAWLRPRDRVTVWTLAVGNGTATVVELPDGRTLLYDCGSRSPFDAAGRAVVPFLRERGIREIDWAFVSHPDMDHYSSIAGVADVIPIRRLALNGHFEDFGADQPAVAAFLEDARARGIAIERIGRGWKLPGSGDAMVECLWPPAAGAFITNDNSSSTVLRIAYKGRSMLLPGDIDNYALDQLVVLGGVSSDALQLPHHGSVTASTKQFLDIVGARSAVRSSGQHDRDTRNELMSLVGGMEYFNTADAGGVVVTLSAAGVESRPHRTADASSKK